MKGKVSVHRGICLLVISWGALIASAEAADINLRVANLSQDLELLSREVAILRMEVETLRRENAQLKESLASGIANQAITKDKLVGSFRVLSPKRNNPCFEFINFDVLNTITCPPSSPGLQLLT